AGIGGPALPGGAAGLAAGTMEAIMVPAAERASAWVLARLDAPRPGQLRQAVPLDMLAVDQADRARPLGHEPVVDLVEALPDQPLLRVGDAALVRLACVGQRAVVGAVAAGGADRGALGRAPGGPGAAEHLAHGPVGGQLVERVGLQGHPEGF